MSCYEESNEGLPFIFSSRCLSIIEPGRKLFPHLGLVRTAAALQLFLAARLALEATGDKHTDGQHAYIMMIMIIARLQGLHMN